MQSPSPFPSVQPMRRPTEPLVLPETGFVRQKQLLRFVPFSKSTLWRHVQAKQFPAPVRLSEGVTAWRAEDLRRWIAERA